MIDGVLEFVDGKVETIFCCRDFENVFFVFLEIFEAGSLKLRSTLREVECFGVWEEYVGLKQGEVENSVFV